jgi:hypothetical protein
VHDVTVNDTRLQSVGKAGRLVLGSVELWFGRAELRLLGTTRPTPQHLHMARHELLARLLESTIYCLVEGLWSCCAGILYY